MLIKSSKTDGKIKLDDLTDENKLTYCNIIKFMKSNLFN